MTTRKPAIAPYDEISDTITIDGYWTFVMRPKRKITHTGPCQIYLGQWRTFATIKLAVQEARSVLRNELQDSARNTPTGFGFIADMDGNVFAHGEGRRAVVFVEYYKGGTVKIKQLKLPRLNLEDCCY